MYCPNCGKENDKHAHFCFHCGAEMQDVNTPTGLIGKVNLYAMSILIPPFGLRRTIRYIRSPDPVAQRMGTVSLVLTIISLLIAIWLSWATVSAVFTVVGV